MVGPHGDGPPALGGDGLEVVVDLGVPCWAFSVCYHETQGCEAKQSPVERFPGPGQGLFILLRRRQKCQSCGISTYKRVIWCRVSHRL